MISNLLKDIKGILKKMNLLKFPEFRSGKISLEGDNIEETEISRSDSFCTNSATSDILVAIGVFTLLDIFIDTKYPNLQERTFSRKYQSLPSSTQNIRNIILKELYRIMKLVRNGIVHSRSLLNISHNTANISYDFKGTNFRLNTRKLDLIYTLLVLLIEYDSCESRYIDSYYSGYYKEIHRDVLINDEIGENLLYLPPHYSIFKRVRYIISNPKVSFKNNKIEINPVELYEQEKKFSACDYLISVGSQYYIIPEEVIYDRNLLTCEDLKGWELKDCVKLFTDLTQTHENT